MPAVWQHTYSPCHACRPRPSLAVTAGARHTLATHVTAQVLPSQRPAAAGSSKPALLRKPQPRPEPPTADKPAAVEAAEALQQAASQNAATCKADQREMSDTEAAADGVSSVEDTQCAGGSTNNGAHAAAGAGVMPEALLLYMPARAVELPQSQLAVQEQEPPDGQHADKTHLAFDTLPLLERSVAQQQQQQQQQHHQQHQQHQEQEKQQQQEQEQEPKRLSYEQRQHHKQDVRLRKQLLALKEWQEWAAFLQIEGPHLSAASIVAAFIQLRALHATSTAALTRPGTHQHNQKQQLDEQAQHQVVKEQQQQIGQAAQQQEADQQQQQQQQQQEAPNVTWAALVALVLSAAPQFAPVQWSQLAYTAAKLGRRDRALLAAVAAHTAAQLAGLKGAGLVNALWAFAALDISPGEPWLEAHCTAAAAQLPSLNPHQLVTLLWSWGRLGHRPPAAVVQALLSRLSRSFKAQSSTELSNTVWALARLSYVPSKKWMRRWFYVSRPVLVKAATDAAAANAASSQGAHLLACMAGSLAALRIAPPKHWHSAWTAALRAQWSSLSARQLGVVLCALAKQRRPLHPRWLGMVAHRFAELLPSASLADIAAVVWALPKLAHPNATRYSWRLQRRGLLAAVARATEADLGRATTGQLVQLASGLAGLRYYPGVHWMKMHENAAAAQHGALSKLNRERLRRAYCALWGVQR